MAIPYGIRAPRVAVIDDVALNSLTIGRGHDAWIVLTTGLIREMPHHELDAVLAFQLARVAVREVSLDTVVYACTGRTLELWGGAFDEIDEVALLLLPAAVIATPFALAAGVLRLSAVRAGARLGDGLALRAMRDPAALVAALRRIEGDPRVIRNAELSTAHLWLEYPHTRLSRFFMRSTAVLPARIARLSRAGRPGGTLDA
jgi:Zn-dependent protease with chaperone function